MTTESKAFYTTQTLILHFCIWFLYGFILIEIIDLVYAFSQAVMSPSSDSNRLLLTKSEVSSFAAVFLTIVISLELAETLKVYIHAHTVRIRLILMVGLTAITRHLLAADLNHADAMLNFSLAALTVALAAAYFLIGHSAGKDSEI